MQGKLHDLKEQLYQLTKAVQEGRIDAKVAADKIVHLREEILLITKSIKSRK